MLTTYHLLLKQILSFPGHRPPVKSEKGFQGGLHKVYGIKYSAQQSETEEVPRPLSPWRTASSRSIGPARRAKQRRGESSRFGGECRSALSPLSASGYEQYTCYTVFEYSIDSTTYTGYHIWGVLYSVGERHSVLGEISIYISYLMREQYSQSRGVSARAGSISR